MKIIEKKYRGSVLCRILGYPITYAIVKMLLEKGPMSLEKITALVKISKPGVVAHLRKLKIANIIRYEKRWPKTYYWIKYPKEVRAVLKTIDTLVTRTTKRIRKDH
jgi:DNA-binding transcriptional regulator GbsR (MarR family)